MDSNRKQVLNSIDHLHIQRNPNNKKKIELQIEEGKLH